MPISTTADCCRSWYAGFGGRILATRGTIDLCSYMLPDAGGIQEIEVEALNRRNAARGRAGGADLHKADAVAALQSFRAVDYDQWIEVIPGRPRPLLERRPSARFGLDRD